MNVNEWVKKADDDLRTAELIIQVKDPMTWVICFHCQQAAEKYLKAYLTQHWIEFEKVHDLMYLLRLCMNKDLEFKEIEFELGKLNIYSVTPRYVFDKTIEYTVEEAKEAIEKAKKVKEFVKKKLEGYSKNE